MQITVSVYRDLKPQFLRVFPIGLPCSPVLPEEPLSVAPLSPPETDCSQNCRESWFLPLWMGGPCWLALIMPFRPHMILGAIWDLMFHDPCRADVPGISQEDRAKLSV